MKFLMLYFLIGAVTAIWTAINQTKLNDKTDKPPLPSLWAAYVLIAFAWPISVVIFFYTIVSHLFGEHQTH